MFRITLLSIYLSFIHEKSSAIYRIADHISIGNLHRIVEQIPSDIIHEKMTREKERKNPNTYDRRKSPEHMIERRKPNVYDRKEKNQTYITEGKIPNIHM